MNFDYITIDNPEINPELTAFIVPDSDCLTPGKGDGYMYQLVPQGVGPCMGEITKHLISRLQIGSKPGMAEILPGDYTPVYAG